jgi:hypothetical protein
MFAKPQQEHEWLNKLVGDWSYETDPVECEPGKPPEQMKGSESVRLLGGLWAICEGKSSIPGGDEHRMVMTIGYDPEKGYLGTWIGSMMTHMWIYKGELDSSGKKLTLSAEGPDFVEKGKTAQYRDTIEFVDDDYRTLTSTALQADGTWKEFMKAHYRRK